MAMPGGIFGGYNEPGFPIYFVNNRMLEYLNYPNFEAFQKNINGHLLNSIPDSERCQVESAIAEAFQKGDTYTVTHLSLIHILLYAIDDYLNLIDRSRAQKSLERFLSILEEEKKDE